VPAPGRVAARLLALSLSVALALGCATRLERPGVSAEEVEAERLDQLERAAAFRLEQEYRLWRVGTRLLVAGAEQCGDQVRPVFPVALLAGKDLPKEYHDVLGRLGLHEGVQVWKTLDLGSPLPEAVRPGARVEALNGSDVEDREGIAKAIEKARESGRLTLTLLGEDGTEQTAALDGVPACAYGLGLQEGDVVNAYADGSNVVLFLGMMRFAVTDDEIAVVIGHELAHNALGHVKQSQAVSIGGTLLGILLEIGAAAAGVSTGGAGAQLGKSLSTLLNMKFGPELEADADYMGLYLVARAALDPSVAPEFWRRMAETHPEGIEKTMLSTHPSTPQRAAVLRKTIEEIEARRAAGEPLLPTKRLERPGEAAPPGE
jgi:Zn-dependent protease with chaperone function